jgi:hypothetical protein
MADAESMTPKELREAYDAMASDLASAKKELADAKAAQRLSTARDAFRQRDLNEAQAELFIAAYPDGEVSPEDVAQFASKYNLRPQSSESDATLTPEAPPAEQEGSPADTDLSLMSRGGTRPGSGGQQPAGAASDTMSREEWEELARDNPAAARLAVSQGKVLLRKDNFYVREYSNR